MVVGGQRMTAIRKMGIGIVGCGSISGVYLKNMRCFRSTVVVACADLEIERARAKAEEFGVPKVLTVDELLADPEIEIILNLTVPSAHASVCQQALAGGKHVYLEKPLAVNRRDGIELVDTAAGRNLRIGAALDTFMGGGL